MEGVRARGFTEENSFCIRKHDLIDLNDPRDITLYGTQWIKLTSMNWDRHFSHLW